MSAGKTGVSSSHLGICAFRPFRQNARFICYNRFSYKCGIRRNLVERKIPKLVFAGSSPVARSMNFPTLPSGGVFF